MSSHLEGILLLLVLQFHSHLLGFLLARKSSTCDTKRPPDSSSANPAACSGPSKCPSGWHQGLLRLVKASFSPRHGLRPHSQVTIFTFPRYRVFGFGFSRFGGKSVPMDCPGVLTFQLQPGVATARSKTSRAAACDFGATQVDEILDVEQVWITSPSSIWCQSTSPPRCFNVPSNNSGLAGVIEMLGVKNIARRSR